MNINEIKKSFLGYEKNDVNIYINKMDSENNDKINKLEEELNDLKEKTNNFKDKVDILKRERNNYITKKDRLTKLLYNGYNENIVNKKNIADEKLKLENELKEKVNLCNNYKENIEIFINDFIHKLKEVIK